MKRNTGASPVDGGLFKKSLISLPAEKILSCPWITTARTALSSWAAASASAMAPYIAEVIEFFFSRRLMVIVITPAST